ncbi:MAG: MFS transporter [Saprospiraceae bacterium]
MLRNSALYILDSFRGLSREVWLLSLVTLINRSGTVVILFLTLYLTEELGFSKGDAGFIAGSYGVGSLAGAYIGGWLTDRFGYFHIIVASFILVGLLFFTLIHFTSFWPLSIMLGLTSLVGDSFRPASMAAISAYSTEENRTRSLSLYRLAINMGFAVGAGGAGWLAGAYGYEWLFYIDGITCIAAGIVFLLLLPNRLEAVDEATEQKPILKSAYQDNWYLGYIFFLMLNTIAFVQLFSAFPVFCRQELGLLESDIGLLMTINGIMLVVLEMPIVHYLVERKQTMNSIIGGVVLIGLGYLCFNIFGFTYFSALLYIGFITLGEIVNFPFATSVALERSTPGNRGQYMGLYGALWSFAAIIGPILGLNIAESYGFTELWYFLGVICALGTTGLLFLRGAQVSDL